MKILKILKISGMILETSRNPKQVFFCDEILFGLRTPPLLGIKNVKILKNSRDPRNPLQVFFFDLNPLGGP